MQLKYLNFELKVEDADSKGMIRGFASTFGNIDQGMDVVDKGAFKKTLKESRGIIPILADHDPRKQIGLNLRGEETDQGLYVEGQLNMKDAEAVKRYELAKMTLDNGGKMGLSIGYSTIKAEPDAKLPLVRRLKELKLWEYSMVTFPMNTEAMVTGAKGWLDSLESKDPEHFVDAFLEKAKSLGIAPDVLGKALRRGAAACESYDPTRVGQSLDTIINMLKS